MSEIFIKNITIDNTSYSLYESTYIDNDRTALLLKENDGTPYAILSVNLPEVDIISDKFIFLATYKPHIAAIVEILEKEGIVKITNITIPSGFVNVNLYKILWK